MEKFIELEPLSTAELIAAVELEFADVTREGGVSWLEADALDGGGQQYLYDIAKERDIETCWQELVDSTTWDIGDWSGNWSFLDPIGFRYYLAAAIVRELKTGEEVLNHNRFRLGANEDFSEFSESQRRLVAEVVLYKVTKDRSRDFPDKVGKPVEASEALSSGRSFKDSDWSSAYVLWEKHLPVR